MIGIGTALHRAIEAAGLVIAGVSIGTKADKGTWRVDFTKPPTPDEKALAASVIAAFDPAAPIAAAPDEFEQIKARMNALEATASVLTTQVEDIKSGAAVVRAV